MNEAKMTRRHEFSTIAFDPRVFTIGDKGVPVMTCSVSGDVLNGHSRHYIIERKKDLPWFIARTSNDRWAVNFQGNPLWPQAILSPHPQMLEVFGLTTNKSDETTLVPSWYTINRTLKELSNRSKEGTFFQFTEGHVETKNFVNQFIEDRKIPAGETGSLDFFHDWSYHFVPLLFSTYMENLRLTLLSIRSRLYDIDDPSTEFSEYSWSYYGHTLDELGQYVVSHRKERLSREDSIFRQMALSIDVFSAKLTQISFCLNCGFRDKIGNELVWAHNTLSVPSDITIRSVLPYEKDLRSFLNYQGDENHLSRSDTLKLALKEFESSLGAHH
ncbi:hypothetical protein [Tateyamaria sp.]|uniref:hypothetical protein n=1 Tax=Tateyamaria sp. TaxID=1929288 RepID=UPI00329CB2F8